MPPTSDDLWAPARARWPAIRVSSGALDAFLSLRLERLGPSPPDPSTLALADIYLLCAYNERDPAAAALLQGLYIARLEPLCRKLGRPDMAPDIQQAFMERLLQEAGPGFCYEGRGALSSWLIVAATRAIRRGRDRDARRVCDVELEERLIADGDPELELMKVEHRERVKAAFGRALASLTPRDRNLLRYVYVDGLSLDALATLHHKHRATIARWLGAVREKLTERTHHILERELAGRTDDLPQVLGIIRSRLGLSMMKLLDAADRGEKPADPIERTRS